MNIIKLILLIPLIYSCIEAASNNRGKKPGDKPRSENEVCSVGDTTRQCATSFDQLMVSQMYRTKNAKQLSYYEENELIVKGKLPSIYRAVPNPAKDNDKEMNKITLGDAGEYGKNNCGVLDGTNQPYSSVKTRINSCFAQHEGSDDGKSVWNGQEVGQSGEGQWKMVLGDNLDDTDTSNDIIWWRDMRTGLVWSHAMPNEVWKYASGAFDRDEEDDVIPTCEQLNDITATPENLKGQIAWRLPNRNEFLQADLDGARSIFGQANTEFWTASTAYLESEAWVIKQSTGELKKADKDAAYPVRCVGVVIK